MSGVWDNFGVGSRPSSSAFAGRQAEFDLLWTTFAGLESTGAQSVLVGGDAGIGKTRLVETVLERARDAGALVAVGVCTPAEGGGLPYGPVVGVLRDLTRQLDEPSGATILGPARQGLGLSDRPAGPAGLAGLSDGSAAGSGEMVKTTLFEALLHGLTVLAERSPVVVVFEDLQWADSASVEVIEFLARNLGRSPLLLIGTYRSDEPGQDQPVRRLLGELSRHRTVSHVALTGLDREATAVLMTEILGRRPDWALLDAVHARSEGNPFFVEELTAARDAASLPPALRHVIMLRIERLSPSARHVVALAAAAGAVVDHRLLVNAGDLDAATLEAAVAEAVALRVLAVEDRTHLRFRHALQREAAYDALLPTERGRLHYQLATALAAFPDLGAAGPGYAAVERAHHWWEAGEWSEAMHASIAAGDAAAALLAMREAYAHYERAVRACERLPDYAGRGAIDYVGLLLKAADAAYIATESQRSTELVNMALAAIDPAAEPFRAAECLTKLGRNAWFNGRADDAFDAFSRAAALLPSDPPSIELVAVMTEEARGLMLLSRYAEAEAACHRTIALARSIGARAEEGHALTTLGVCVAERGDHDTGVVVIREAVAIAEALASPDHLNRAYTNLTHVLMGAGRLEEAATLAFECRAGGDPYSGIRMSAIGQNCAEALIRLGRLDEAEVLLDRIEDQSAGCVFGPHGVQAIIATRRGDFEEAAERLESAEVMSAGLATVQVLGRLHMLRAELALEQGQAALASEELDRGLTIAAGSDDNSMRLEMCTLAVRALADSVEVGVRARVRRVDAEKSREVAAALVEEASHHIALMERDGRPCPLRARAFMATCRAEESRLIAAAPDLWLAAAELWDEAGEPFPAAYCRWREAEAVLSVGGGRARAADATQAAWSVCLALGARPLMARVERLAQRARFALAVAEESPADSPRRAVADDLGLTLREVEVLAQLALGRTDRQIAEELYISRKTASAHVSNILRKLDVTNRVEAGEVGQRAGLS